MRLGRSAIMSHYLSYNVQPQAVSVLFLVVLVVPELERLEDLLMFFDGNSSSVVEPKPISQFT